MRWVVPLTTQVDRLLGLRPTLGTNDLVFLWAGANDGFVQFATISAGGATPTNGVVAMATEAGVMAQQVQRLRQAGAKFVVLALLPDLANTPFGALVSQASQQGGELLSALSRSFNQTALSAVPQAGAVVVDVNKLLSDVISNPVKYGFNANALGMTACGVNVSATGPNDFYNSSLQCLGVNQMGPTAASLGNVDVPRPQRSSWNAVLGFALPQQDAGVWTVQLGMGGPKNKLEAHTLGASYRKQF